MGVIVAAGLLSHVPSIMLPEAERRRRYAGRDTSFPQALGAIYRERVQPATFDTFIIFDTHWFTTRGFVVNTQEHLTGIYTSDELPGTLHDMAFDYRGDKMLGEAIVDEAQKIGLRCEGADYQGMALHYPTLNLMHHLNPRQQHRVLSVGVCQTASHERNLEVGLAIGRAIQQADRRVVILAAGGLSHRFWSYDDMAAHSSPDPAHISKEANRAYDEKIIALLKRGEHASVIKLVPDFRATCSPEGLFAHYSMLAGALGGEACSARATQYGEYENAIGTGQVMLWFPL
ncbi:MAG: catechol 1,2-dioxygenase [Candidatus Rokubacteria bacterium]|nr:catechol 1,2-dioxygenase [Candidatus Rokubacteria bacterium]